MVEKYGLKINSKAPIAQGHARSERQTLDRVFTLFRDPLGYRYLGD